MAAELQISTSRSRPQFAKDRSLHGGEDGENKANLTLLQMAMDDVSDSEADPLGANCPEDGPNLGPNPMLSENRGEGSYNFLSTTFFRLSGT